ncbi:uncharacterized protein [Pagrus major]|uniref:uncharacterized protein n=1 Tax=Pagrus major TaxID=143350 RepID=UPI003CC8458E
MAAPGGRRVFEKRSKKITAAGLAVVSMNSKSPGDDALCRLPHPSNTCTTLFPVNKFRFSYITCKNLRGLTMLLLLSCWIIAGITAEDSPTRHYRLKNSSFCLRFGNSSQDVMWTFNKHLIVLNKKVKTNKDRMEYNPSDISLCINNVNEMDSGIYEIIFINSLDKQSTTTHMLTVEDSVSRPVIRMSAMHSNQSAGFCNITVNCSVQDNWMWSVCDEDSCRPYQRSFGNINITITPQNRSIVCSVSNHVSTSNASESTQTACFDRYSPKPEETPQPSLWIVIVFIVCMCVFACIVCLAIVHFSTGYKRHQAQTSPVLLISNEAVEAQPQPVARVSSSSSSGAEASYENVDAGPTSSPSISPTERSQTVDTVYSYLQAPKATASGANSDSMEVREGSASQSVPLDEARQPVQIDTVYSVLQKPKHLKSQHNQ